MTPLLRPSMEARVTSGIGRVAAALVGLVFLAVGVVMLVVEMKAPPFHPVHVYVAAGLMTFGALLIVPSAVTSGLSNLVVIVGPFLPTFGNRKGDIAPAPPGIAPGTPVPPPDQP